MFAYLVIPNPPVSKQQENEETEGVMGWIKMMTTDMKRKGKGMVIS